MTRYTDDTMNLIADTDQDAVQQSNFFNSAQMHLE